MDNEQDLNVEREDRDGRDSAAEADAPETELEAAAEAGYLEDTPEGEAAEVELAAADDSADSTDGNAADVEPIFEVVEEIEDNQEMIDEGAPVQPETEPLLDAAAEEGAVSYTHLTLPTICSV